MQKDGKTPNSIPDFLTEGFLAGGGDIGAQMRSKDWAATPLGVPASWPQTLKTTLRIMLDSRYALWLGWGRELLFFYNDVYARNTLGKKHPWALARPASEVWAEVWSDLAPRVEHVFTHAQATWDEGLLLFLERNGYPEETYHTFSYSPLYDDNGNVGGMLCVVTEETDRVIAERRADLLKNLASGLTATKTEKDVFETMHRCLKFDSKDLPFTLTYLSTGEKTDASLMLATGGDPAHPETAHSNPAAWPLTEVFTTNQPAEVSELGAR